MTGGRAETNAVGPAVRPYLYRPKPSGNRYHAFPAIVRESAAAVRRDSWADSRRLEPVSADLDTVSGHLETVSVGLVTVSGLSAVV